MARAKLHGGMGVVTMVIVLVVIVAVLPMALRIVLRSISGFEDTPTGQQASTANLPQMVGGSKNYADVDDIPDPNTNYLCRSPNLSGVPCPEGTFCDGSVSPQVCRSKVYKMGVDAVTGFFQ